MKPQVPYRSSPASICTMRLQADASRSAAECGSAGHRVGRIVRQPRLDASLFVPRARTPTTTWRRSGLGGKGEPHPEGAEVSLQVGTGVPRSVAGRVSAGQHLFAMRRGTCRGFQPAPDARIALCLAAARATATGRPAVGTPPTPPSLRRPGRHLPTTADDCPAHSTNVDHAPWSPSDPRLYPPRRTFA
jgi:hypothetical protein